MFADNSKSVIAGQAARPQKPGQNKKIQRERQYNKFQITGCNANTSRVILRQLKSRSIYLVIAKGYPLAFWRGANALLGASGKVITFNPGLSPNQGGQGKWRRRNRGRLQRQPNFDNCITTWNYYEWRRRKVFFIQQLHKRDGKARRIFEVQKSAQCSSVHQKFRYALLPPLMLGVVWF